MAAESLDGEDEADRQADATSLDGLNDAAMVAALLACDAKLGGVVLRGPPGEARDGFLATLRALLAFSPWRRLPLHADEDRLLGGLDLAATLATGRPCRSAGLLAEASGGVLVVAMAERVTKSTASCIAAAMDAGAGFRLVLLDEGRDDSDEAAPACLVDRCAFMLVPDLPDPLDATAVAAARLARDGIVSDEAAPEAICTAAQALGLGSARPQLFALRAARAATAFAGRDLVEPAAITLAARLVLGWRAVRLPQESQQEPQRQDPPADPASEPAAGEDESKSPDSLNDITVRSAAAGIPPGLLAALQAGRPPPGKGGGRAAAMLRQGMRHGRPAGTRRGEARGGARLAILATLRAAAPWQRLRRAPGETRLAIRRSDMHIQRTKPRATTTTIFAVDASGSAAMARLAEAKGAVEQLLAECYIRRDEVAVIAFRGMRAEILLPPTRSLTRAKRALAQLPGGGGTPLSAGLIAAASLAEAVRRAGRMPSLVLLTDGRANVARDGTPGRARAESEANEAARGIAAMFMPCLLIDTATRPQPAAQAVAAAMAARYLPLPQAGGGAIASAIRQQA